MNYVRYFLGALVWRMRAGLWYIGLGFRLFFAIGLDSNYEHGSDEDLSRHFKCPIPRNYRKHLEQNRQAG